MRFLFKRLIGFFREKFFYRWETIIDFTAIQEQGIELQELLEWLE